MLILFISSFKSDSLSNTPITTKRLYKSCDLCQNNLLLYQKSKSKNFGIFKAFENTEHTQEIASSRNNHFTARQELTNEQIFYYVDCSFQNIRAEKADGGAIYSKSPLNITSCIFSHTFAELTGGAIYCQNNANISRSTFESCQASHTSAVNIKGNYIVNLTDSKFYNCISRSEGTYRQEDATAFTSLRTNFSHDTTEYTYNNIQCNQGSPILKYTKLMDSKGSMYCSGITLRYCDSLFIDFTIFYNLSKIPEDGLSGEAVCIQDNKEDMIICQSTFTLCNQHNKSSIFAQGSCLIKVVACCFDQKRMIEKAGLYYSVKFSGCFFGAECDISFSLAEPQYPLEKKIDNRSLLRIVTLFVLIVLCIARFITEPIMTKTPKALQ